MKVYYTLKEQAYEAKDIELAMQCAETASINNGWPVRALIETLAQKDVFIGVSGFTFQCSNQFRYGSISGAVTTRIQFQTGAGEILVAVCPTIQLLHKIQSYSTCIEMLFVVPEIKSDTKIYTWLDLNSAKDLESGAVLSGIGLPVKGIKRAINYLQDYCKRNTVDLNHITVQKGEMTDVVNAIKKQGLSVNDKEVVKYCLQKRLQYSEAVILAKAFAQKTLLQTRGCPNYDIIWNTINDSRWDK